MTVAFAEVGGARSDEWTGATLYDAMLLDPEEYAANKDRTHLVPTGVTPQLQSVLESFHNALIHKLTGLVDRIELSAMLGSSSATLTGSNLLRMGSSRSFGWYSSAASYVPVGQGVTFMAPEPYGFVNVPSSWVTGVNSTTIETSGILFLDKSTYSTGLQELIVAEPTPKPLAVQAVEDIADWFGVPAADVFKATGIAKRTYQEWKRSGTRRPRASSEGSLWELHNLAADLVETMGPTGVRHWLNEDSTRRRLLRSGAVDKLASQAYASLPSVQPRPAWVGAGSAEQHVAPRRAITLDAMDPGDVVEPES
jgi:hypothetical protein